jgi:hypothetical protein
MNFIPKHASIFAKSLTSAPITILLTPTRKGAMKIAVEKPTRTKPKRQTLRVGVRSGAGEKGIN